MKGLAIIDDHSTVTLVNPIVIKELQFAQKDITEGGFTASTVNGVQHKKTHIIKDLLLTPVSGDAPILINEARTCQLPDVLKDVPTPQEVLSIPGLSHLAEKFPSKKEWPTLILIGRDCAQVQKHLQTATSADKHQLAIQTPLGWTIMCRSALASDQDSSVAR